MGEKQKKAALRSIIWNLCFYGLCVFCVFYLKSKLEIKNFDVLFVFLPLIFLAFSTEDFKTKKFKILNIVDFVIKILAYSLSQLVFRRIAIGPYFWICIIFLFICFVFSIASSVFAWWKITKKIDNSNP